MMDHVRRCLVFQRRSGRGGDLGEGRIINKDTPWRDSEQDFLSSERENESRVTWGCRIIHFAYSWMLIHFDRIYERDGRTDRQTDGRTPHDGIRRACIACIARQKRTDTAPLIAVSECGYQINWSVRIRGAWTQHTEKWFHSAVM